MNAIIRSTTLAAVLAALAGATARAQEPQSAAAAARLTALLDAKKLDAIAARDPDNPDRFIAALYFPGSQLLVVSAAYPVPPVLERRIAEHQYREAYTDLQGAGVREGRFFVTDLQADGLRAARERGEPFDIAYTDGTTQVSYDGDWKGQKLTEEQYTDRFRDHDARYARLLDVLARAVDAGSDDA